MAEQGVILAGLQVLLRLFELGFVILDDAETHGDTLVANVHTGIIAWI
jgi:hypothetical protein